MALTFVVRLVAGHAASGRLVGHVEIVRTGEIVPVRDVADLVELVRRAAADDPATNDRLRRA